MNKRMLMICGLVAFGLTAVAGADTFTGEVVDIDCYVSHGAHGSKHSECAAECIRNGLPVGLLTDDGKLYLLVGKNHKSLNQQLEKHATKRITVDGALSEKDGIKLIIVEKCEAAKEKTR